LLKGAVIKNLTVQLNVYEILLAIRDVERRFDILLNCKPSMPIGSGLSWDIIIVDNCTIQLNVFPLFENPFNNDARKLEKSFSSSEACNLLELLNHLR
jgi:hypothetical protein